MKTRAGHQKQLSTLSLDWKQTGKAHTCFTEESHTHTLLFIWGPGLPLSLFKIIARCSETHAGRGMGGSDFKSKHHQHFSEPLLYICCSWREREIFSKMQTRRRREEGIDLCVCASVWISNLCSQSQLSTNTSEPGLQGNYWHWETTISSHHQEEHGTPDVGFQIC